MFLFLLLLVGCHSLWVVELPHGVTPAEFARSHHLLYKGPTEVSPDFHMFEETKLVTRAVETQIKAAAKWAEQQVPQQRFKRAAIKLADDPLYEQQWHLHGSGVDVPAGVSGSGVTIAIVDDGLEHAHPEIAPNYDAAHSWNFNGGPSFDPTPQWRGDGHGTSAAAVAAGAKLNGHCGRGVAPGAKLVGFRLIADPATDLQEATALSKFADVIHIYSNSWGPSDTGQSMERPGRLVRETFARYAGGLVGRQGKGTIYVWASGNGNNLGDSCAYDGYAGSPYVNAIGAIDSTGKQAWYSEGCANLLAVTPSSGMMSGITTADLVGSAGYDPGECTDAFGGTSSAAPLAAGIMALLLERNPHLTWRDVRHVIAKGATLVDAGHSSWHTNAAGFHHSNVYGFGLLRIPALLTALAQHTLVPATQKQLFFEPSGTTGNVFQFGVDLVLPFEVPVQNNFTFIETAIITVKVTHAQRGTVEISLRSPEGTVTSFTETHRDNNANYPADGWVFSSLHHWGERRVQGTWELRFRTSSRNTGHVMEAHLAILGY